MGYKFNPLIFSGLDIAGGASVTTWKSPVETVADLPLTDADGVVRVVLDESKIYVFDADTSKWYDIEITLDDFETLASDKGVRIDDTDEVIGSVTVVRRSFALTPADATHPGSVTTTNQSFSGDKTFNNDVTVVNDLTVGNDVSVTRNGSIGNDLTVGNNASVTADLSVGGNSTISGTETVTGNFSALADAHIYGSTEVDGNTVIHGDLTVNGTTTTVNSTNLEITDKNILVNKDGDDTTAEGAGITVQRTTVNGSIVYDKDVATFWKIGNEGSEVEVVDVSTTQTLTNKTIDADSNSITNIENDNIKVGAAIDAEKLADGSVSNTEFQYIGNLTSDAQAQIDSKINLSEKGVADGVATLDSNGLVPESQLPNLVKIDTFIVNSEADMLALTAEKGDHALRTDLNTTFILRGTDPSVITDWQEIISRVNSVNGYDRDVVLTTTDISEGTNLYYTDTRAQTAAVTDTPVWTETVQAASARATKEYVDSQETQAIQESQTDAVLTDLVTNYGVNSGCKLLISVMIDADTNLYQIFDILVVKNDTGYHVGYSKVGDETYIDFDVNSSGELTYTSSTYTGFVSGSCVIKVIPLL